MNVRDDIILATHLAEPSVIQQLQQPPLGLDQDANGMGASEVYGQVIATPPSDPVTPVASEDLPLIPQQHTPTLPPPHQTAQLQQVPQHPSLQPPPLQPLPSQQITAQATSLHQLAMQPTQHQIPANPIPQSQLHVSTQPSLTTQTQSLSTQQTPSSLLLPQTSPSNIASQQTLRPSNPPSPYQPSQPVTPPPRQVKFENALDFLDQVKLQFAKQPRVYNQFLDIMKDFKAQYIDTPGVIARVTELFKGHKHLILGFNTFLPPGYKIELPDDEKPNIVPPAPVHTPTSASQAVSAPRKQPEFDHARNYVKKIKTRFNTQPHVYKAFLEILHTYHKEQHTIKDVYDQVAKLFAQHADLLEEFTQFLPDPVAGNTVAPISTSPVTNAAHSIPAGSRGSKSRPARFPPKGKGSVVPSPSTGASEKEVPSRDRGIHHAGVSERRAPKRPARNTRTEENLAHPPKRVAHDAEERDKERDRERVAPDGNYEELDFFFRVKNTLNNQNIYHEFLKCLNLFSQEIISRVELVLLVKDLLSRWPDLFDWFKHFIGFDDHSLELLEKKEALVEENRPLSEINWPTCRRHGPSYRALPKTFVGAKCSGRTELCNAVLNDQWVSVPTGSEDFTFKNMRKNQYEEVLFKCEDERYELDLVIELNCSAIRALEPYCVEIEKLTEEESSNYKIKTPLDVLHVRSIERLYGEKGFDIVEGIYANPIVAIPIVLNRLKQKDQEWKNSRREWNKVWHEVTEKNYYKSLDHQSFFFKQQEKKNLSPKVLLAEIKQQYADRLREKELEKEVTTSRERPARTSLRGKDKEKEREGKVDTEGDSTLKYHLKYSMDNESIFLDIAELMSFAADKNLSKSDKEKIDTFLKHFLNVFFKFDNTDDQVKSSTTAPVFVVDVKSEPMDTEQRALVSTEGLSQTEGTAAGKFVEEAKARTEEKRVKQVFFGNNTFYIFFRLHQILYERLAKAKELAKISQKAKWNSKSIRPLPRANGDNTTTTSQPPSPSSIPPSPSPSLPPAHTSVASPATPSVSSPFPGAIAPSTTTSPTVEGRKDRYQSFIEKLYSLLAGATDQTHYEDECRGLLGISSYVLFTLDKLVIQLTRQLQALLTSENCSKLLSLYSYESQRPNGVVESVYHMSCAEFLNEERLFLFEYEQSPRVGTFTIQLLDSSSQTTPKFVEFSFEPSKYSEYVTSFTRDSSKIDPRKHKVFLVRNQKINREDAAILNGVVNENNLECRICLSTYRLFYVEDTEDFFYRPKGSRPNTSPTPRRNISRVLEKLMAGKTSSTVNNTM